MRIKKGPSSAPDRPAGMGYSTDTILRQHYNANVEMRRRRRQQILRQKREEMSRQNGDGAFDG